MRLYWDANAFITLVENGGAISERLGELLERAAGAEIAIVTSELTLAELLVRPLREGNAERVNVYRDLLAAAGTVETLPISRKLLISTAQIRADHPTAKLPDAIHIASAELSHCGHFLSADLRLPVRPAFNRVNLDLASLDQLLAEFDD